MPWWQATRETVAMVVGLGTLALLCLSWFPAAAVLHLLLPRRTGQWLGRRVACHGFRFYLRVLELACGCRFDLAALDGLGREGAMIVAANHPSLLDAVLLVSRLPNAVCIMKAALLDNPMFGAGARLARYIRNDNLVNLISRSRAALREGTQIIVFPEGSRTEQFPIDRVLPSIGLVAQRAQVPVQVVLLDFSSPYLGKGWPIWRRPSLPLVVTARLGQRFDAPQDVPTFTDALQRHFDDALSPESADAATDTARPCTPPRPISS
ncbi:MAG: 1-acyl-sn-glycerol-3-phosphate acyltransferase [Hydrogenophaga sp.]|nr:1-acyl-sn-glycerol-3-phosphate acyltransferase [Hydrogenophaga sp.]